MMSTNEDIARAWAAGFADGEACISLARQTFACGRRPTYRMRFDVTQNNREILLHFQQAVGVTGRLYAPRRTTRTNRQLYQLTYDGKQAHDVIQRLHPWLIRKQPEAAIALRYMNECRVGWHPGPKGFPEALWKARESFYWKLRKMK